MKDKEMIGAADKLGLSIETRYIEGHDPAYAVYKGAKQVFIGTRDAVLEFLSTYEDKRPLPYEGSMYGYRE